MAKENPPADIAIVGGGPSGLAFAAICERKGLDYIVYERSKRETAPRGACLDLHPGSGQRAMKAAGVFDEFLKHARGGDATTHYVFDRHMNKVFSWGEGRDSPEIDRHEIKATLLTGVPDEKIRWEANLESAVRDDNGKIVLIFADGTATTGFKLVVGADGTFSKVRPLITTVSPKPWGAVFFSSVLGPDNPFFPKLRERAGEGPMIVLGGKGTMIWNQLEGKGHYGILSGFEAPPDIGRNGEVDLHDVEAVKQFLLQDDNFGQYDQFVKDMLMASDGPIHDWPLWETPPDSLNWESSADVTLIGDSAHSTTPFIGDGANCAMRDSVILAEKLSEFGIGKEAVVAYEKEMFSFAKPMIENSDMSGKLFFGKNAPEEFLGVMKNNNFIGATDDI